MIRAALALTLLAVAAPAGAAQGDRQLNLNAESCGDFLNASPADVATILAWLDGYYQDEDAPPVVDFDSLKTNAAKLKAVCAAHKDETVGAAAESLFGRQ
ncbi:MAG: HdeA/HdeB family chaperone [Pseudomonadota bacterium]